MFGLSWIRYLKLSELLKNYKIIANEPAKLYIFSFLFPFS